jgi:hypothetical protein
LKARLTPESILVAAVEDDDHVRPAAAINLKGSVINRSVSALNQPELWAFEGATRRCYSLTMSPWRWATFHSPSSRRYTWVARRV